MTNADLRRRRHYAAIDGDPLIAFREERDRLEAEISRLHGALTSQAAAHAAALAGVQKRVAIADAMRKNAEFEAEIAKQQRAKDRTTIERQLSIIRDALRGEPEAAAGLHDIAGMVALVLPRMRKERNMATEKAGTLMALMERIDHYLSDAKDLHGDSDFNSFLRAEAGMLQAEIAKAQVSAPFVKALVQVAQAAWKLQQKLDQIGGVANLARPVFETLRKALSEIPDAMLGITPAKAAKIAPVAAEPDAQGDALVSPTNSAEWGRALLDIQDQAASVRYRTNRDGSIEWLDPPF